eukprot:Plantae.Rhodophyta-Hildenbrandia_rubra.ctg20011.p1 GENE.Plantae.Rhodophyta-Hildenbrandia_rubra.ctg20011~~Plantae.Rhodophyta-Hildenbrandia_rubra.ctg20011.p1  ORF type:complete len:132 (+),score=12.41 Plantae.Rhodophyta-Hildenbrandia_rubra.ctg20011:141-536(+)
MIISMVICACVWAKSIGFELAMLYFPLALTKRLFFRRKQDDAWPLILINLNLSFKAAQDRKLYSSRHHSWAISAKRSGKLSSANGEEAREIRKWDQTRAGNNRGKRFSEGIHAARDGRPSSFAKIAQNQGA